MKVVPALTDFLNLNIGSATDAYLRELALQYLRTGQLIATTDNVMTAWQQLESIQREQAAVAQEHIHLQAERRELERDQAAFNQLKAEMEAQLSQVSMQIKAPPGQLVEHRYWIANDGTVVEDYQPQIVCEVLKPKIAVLDETDSGLDVDALRVVSDGVNRYRTEENGGILLITHYTRILRYIKPDKVHVFVGGRVVDTGGAELADQLESEGYEKYLTAAHA